MSRFTTPTTRFELPFRNETPIIIFVVIAGTCGGIAFGKIALQEDWLFSLACGLGGFLIAFLPTRAKCWLNAPMPPMIAFAVLFGLCCVFGSRLDINGQLANGALLLLTSALVGVTVLPLSCLISYALDNIAGASQPTHRYKAPSQRNFEPLFFIICCTIIAITWFIYYLILFPGVYGYDGPFMLRQYIDAATELSSKYSVIYSWAYAHLVMLGRDWFGTYEAGFALFSAIQMLCIFLCAIATLLFVCKRHMPRLLMLAVAVFYALNPVFPTLSVSSSQDPVFMALFTLIVVQIISAFDNPDGFLSSPVKNLSLGLTILAFCLVRNNGLYALLVTALFLGLAVKQIRKRMALVIIAPLILTLVIQGPLYGALGIAKGTAIREMSSVPVMQLCRTYLADPTLQESDDGKAIASYFKKENLEYYEANPCISDIMKAGLNVDAIMDSPLAFGALYLRVGAEHPLLYTEAFALNTLGLWYPFKTYPDSRMYHPWIESECMSNPKALNENNVEIQSKSIIPPLDDALNHYLGGSQDASRKPSESETFSSSLLGTIFIKFGAYFMILLYLTVFFVSRKRWPDLFIAILFWGVLITIFLGPVALCRYVAPLMMALPLLLSCAIKTTADKNHIKRTAKADSYQDENAFSGIKHAFSSPNAPRNYFVP